MIRTLPVTRMMAFFSTWRAPPYPRHWLADWLICFIPLMQEQDNSPPPVFVGNEPP